MWADIQKWTRRIRHLYLSGCIVMGMDHFLVMFPSALLIARLGITHSGMAVISLSAILLTCGLGSLIFLFLVRGNFPFFLGPSFAYIGLTSYLVADISGDGNFHEIKYTILWGYFLSGLLLFAMSYLYRFNRTKRLLHFLFPKS